MAILDDFRLDGKLAVVTKPGSAQNIVAEKFKELVEQRSGAEVEVKIYPGVMAQAVEGLEKILRMPHG